MIDMRNGGFETGDITFWEVVADGTLGIDAANPNRGLYAGKVTADCFNTIKVFNRDYIEVQPYQVISAISWLKSADGVDWRLDIDEFDSDLNRVSGSVGAYKTGTAAYQQNRIQVVIGHETAYIRYSIEISPTGAGDIAYIDDMSLSAMDIAGAGVLVEQIADMSAISVTGDTSDDKYQMRGFNEYVADLRVVTATGTNPTLDVNVMEKDSHGRDRIAGTFAQAIATGHERIAVSAFPGRDLYIDYTVGGTTPVFSFDVSIVGRR